MLANNDPFIKKFNELDAVCKKHRDTILRVWKQRYVDKWQSYSEADKIRLGKGFRLIKCVAELLPEQEETTMKAIITVRNTIHDIRNLFEPTKECLRFLDGIIIEINNGNIGAIDSELANVKKSNVAQMRKMLDSVGYKSKPLRYEEQAPIKAKINAFITQEERVNDVEKAKYVFAQCKNFFNDIPHLPEVCKAREAVRSRQLDKAKREARRELDEDYYDERQEILSELRGFKQRKALSLLNDKYEQYKEQIDSCVDFDELEDVYIDLDVDFYDD